jgi:hypothetical protein
MLASSQQYCVIAVYRSSSIARVDSAFCARHEARSRRAVALARAYDEGAVSWVHALTLLPVVDRENAEAWVSRARAVTVRRRAGEVSWVLEAHDASVGVTLGAPPLDAVLASEGGGTLADRLVSAGGLVSASGLASEDTSASSVAPALQIRAHASAASAVTKTGTRSRATQRRATAAQVCRRSSLRRSVAAGIS